ncbi:MAG: DUF4169 family protein [Alphaproteobacteria bacterium]|nr:DUF4169 family protein [Alphaproteobacteria bacterium]
MGDVINLRQARKARSRAADERRAEINRARHGRSKAEKRAAELARQRYDAVIEGARLEQSED